MTDTVTTTTAHPAHGARVAADATDPLVVEPGVAFDWDVAYRAVAPEVHRFVMRLCRDPELAADLVHEAFVRTMARLAEPTRPVAVRPYLFTTAHNLLRTRLVRDARVTAAGAPADVGQQGSLVTDSDEDPQTRAWAADEARAASAALAALPDRQRSVIVLCDMEECSYAQAGEVLGLGANAVAQLLLRARSRLRLEFRTLHTDTTRLAERCRSNLSAISRLVDGELAVSALEPLEAHLRRCADCARVREDFELAKTRLKGIAVLPLPLGISELDAEIASFAAADTSGRAVRTNWHGRRLQLVIVLLVVVLLLAALLAIELRREPPARPDTAGTERRTPAAIQPGTPDRPQRSAPKRMPRDAGRDRAGDAQARAAGGAADSRTAAAQTQPRPPAPSKPVASAEETGGSAGAEDTSGSDPQVTLPPASSAQPEVTPPPPPPPPNGPVSPPDLLAPVGPVLIAPPPPPPPPVIL